MLGRILRANPGFELLSLLEAAAGYRIAPVIGWRFDSYPKPHAYPTPVTIERREDDPGEKAVRYPDGQVYDLGYPVKFKNANEWLFFHEGLLEGRVKRAVETGQGFTFKAKTAA